MDGVIADVQRSFAADRGDDGPDFVPRAEFAINDSASALGSGYTPFYSDRARHLNPPASPDPATLCGSGEAAAHLICWVTAEVCALLQARQDRRKAELDAHRRDVQFAVGDEVLLDTEHTPLPSRPLSPRWMGPLKVLARPAPNTYTYRLENPVTWRASDAFSTSGLTGCIQRLAPPALQPSPRRSRRSGPAPACPGRRRLAGVQGAEASQVQDALEPALRPGALGGLRRVARHVGAAGQPHQLFLPPSLSPSESLSLPPSLPTTLFRRGRPGSTRERAASRKSSARSLQLGWKLCPTPGGRAGRSRLRAHGCRDCCCESDRSNSDRQGGKAGVRLGADVARPFHWGPATARARELPLPRVPLTHSLDPPPPPPPPRGAIGTQAEIRRLVSAARRPNYPAILPHGTHSSPPDAASAPVPPALSATT